MTQMRLGDSVGLHHEAHHRVGQHFFKENTCQFAPRQLVPGTCVVQVGKRNGQGPCQSRMLYPGMKLHQHRSFPSCRITVVRGQNQLGFDLVLSWRERLAETWNGERPDENGDSLSGQVFQGVVLSRGGARDPRTLSKRGAFPAKC